MDLTRLIPYQLDVLQAVIEHYNQAIWPAPPVAIVFALAAMVLAFMGWRHAGRAIALILGVFWLWCGIAYLGDHYAEINWAGRYYEIAFAVQAALVLGYGAILGRPRIRFAGGVAGWAGLGFAALAIVFHPLIEVGLGHGWLAAQIVGVGPDPTNLVTLALLLMAAGRVPWLLLVIPVLWAVIGGGWAWLLGAPDRMILPFCCLIAVGLILREIRSKPDSVTAARGPT